MNTTERRSHKANGAQTETGAGRHTNDTAREACDGQLTLEQDDPTDTVYVPVADPARLATLESLSRLLRDEAIARANDNADQWWKSCMDTAIAYLASTGVPFTADDCRDLHVPSPDHPARVGARFSAALKAGLIRQTGYAISRSSTRHAGVLRTWVGCDAK